MTPGEINLRMNSLVQKKIKVYREYKKFEKICKRYISLYRDVLESKTEQYQEEINSINKKIQELFIEEIKNSLNKLVTKRDELIDKQSQMEYDFEDASSLGFSLEWESKMESYKNAIKSVEDKIDSLTRKIQFLSISLSI